MSNKVNLNKLREEIDNRKKGRNVVSSKLGENVSEQAPRDSFLHGLVESLKTGKDTASSVLVKSVENKVAEKNGETSRLPVNNNNVLNEHNRNRTTSSGNDMNIDSSQERDELLFAEFDKKRKKTLAESIEDFHPKQQNYNQKQVQPQNQSVSTNMNEGYLNESVKKIVNNYLVENFGPVVEEAINSTILEMYAVERIKDVLQENKDLIKSVVIETIREIQAKNKLKKQ